MEEYSAFVGGRAVLEAAISSNELYPHRPARWRAAGFMNAQTAAYLTGQVTTAAGMRRWIVPAAAGARLIRSYFCRRMTLFMFLADA